LRHANDELFDFLGDPGSARLLSLLAPVKFVGNQALVPAHEGIGCSDGGGVFELCAAQGMGQGRESAAFDIGESQSTVWELGCEHAILFFKIRDHLLLMPIDPVGDG
jgi:hypothetical protein